MKRHFKWPKSTDYKASVKEERIERTVEQRAKDYEILFKLIMDLERCNL